MLWRDQRGYFLETYNHAISDYLQISFVQENESRSSYGTLRGLHFQKDPWAQAKLVRVLRGRVRDVIVDMRQDSATYGQHLFVDLCEDKQEQLFVPPGCAHGFSVLGEEALFAYKCSKPYFPDHDGGILYCDPELGIPWGLEEKDILVSEKDRKHPSLREYHQEENQEELR
ncbi:unnamed protein product [Darwinula stevensoni]|uniref:Uncharacterized protein n=1 Tax=Darwinula stevensoni TaxID=69355 RepID=A0A7R8X9F7_9CRUS|nr:unnamed protein product [Darwinula stevensoni]CAG0888943.1 unnamed protein product [Darwinula stevensoni]